MGSIADIKNPWRELLKTQASFRGVIFHVETGTRTSGRRTVVHEYPKRDDPYSEDMGRHARRFPISGYLIYKPFKVDANGNASIPKARYDYVAQRRKLMNALEADGPGILIHPVFAPPPGISVVCERYSMIENRERGGYTQFEMQFVEEGNPGNSKPQTDTKEKVNNSAKSTEDAAKQSLDGWAPPGTDTSGYTGWPSAPRLPPERPGGR